MNIGIFEYDRMIKDKTNNTDLDFRSGESNHSEFSTAYLHLNQDDSLFSDMYEKPYFPDSAPGGFYRRRGKRALDLCVGLVLLLAFGPLLLFLMALAASDGGPPLFRHTRIGMDGRSFRCLKIRSMVHNAEERLQAILISNPEAAAEWARDHKLSKDPRITMFGAFLRKSSLDELPQLVNVIKGEMSLVGPRPITEPELARYGAFAACYASVRPGLTGPWQVTGRNDISYDSRVSLDTAYALKLTFFGDAVILVRTLLAVFRLTGK